MADSATQAGAGPVWYTDFAVASGVPVAGTPPDWLIGSVWTEDGYRYGGCARMRARDRESMTPVRVEVIAYAPTAFFHCQHCELTFQHIGVGQKVHDEQTGQALPPDLTHDYQALSDWVRALTEHYCGQVIVKVIDAASVEGFWKSLRYGVRRYPAVIVAGQDRCLGTDTAAVQTLIDRRLPTPVSA